MAKFLIQKGIDINNPLPNKITPLHIAVLMDQKDIVSLLLQNGAKQIKTDKGLTPLNLAVKYGNKDIIDLLKGEK